ncbi:hypothetical protein [Dyella subtropica]|uniref:hypothetical protein n=1 Tax=Dyella subtropica TaxID=2992127 RepID=UPI0022508C91|nr:hypothetical protein [Dyella subtropica]
MTESSSKQLPAVIVADEHSRITKAILDFVSQIPGSKVDTSHDPEAEARKLANRAAQRAALTAGSLALPPGPLGWLTVLPELIAIWKIQAQMVSDIAAAYGKHTALGREQMLWCLFRHTAAQAFRDLVVRMGDRLLFRRMSYAVAERIAKRIGVKVTQRTVGKGLSRWLPVVGALGVGAYAYYDTGQVASTAIAMFGSDFETEGAAEPATPWTHAKPGVVRRTTDKVTDKAVSGAARAVSRIARKTIDRKQPPE